VNQKPAGSMQSAGGQWYSRMLPGCIGVMQVQVCTMPSLNYIMQRQPFT
jgi:hypothetical protein